MWVEVTDELYGGISFGCSYTNDWDEDRAIAEQLYAQMMGWA